MSATQTTGERPKSKLWHRVEKLPAGRCRIYIERGAMEHVDQLRLKSERQRERVAQACDAKEPGCYDEVLKLLEREADLLGFKYDVETDDGCRFVFTGADKFLPEPVDWLWERYVPAGAVTILEGDSGVGKSLLLVDLAARVSRGFLAPDRQPAFDEPGHDPEPAAQTVWWFSGQDHFEKTLTPRLRAAGADLPMVRVIEGVEDQKANKCRPVSFPEDFRSLWKSQSQGPRLVVVDPLSSFCGGSLHQATAKKVIGELAKFAAATGAAVVVVRPLNRRVGASASERGSAGPSLTAEARSALLLANHPEDPCKQVLAVVKSNLCARAESLELRIEEGRGSRDEGRAEEDSCGVPVVAWLGRSSFTADELLRARQGADAPRSPFAQKKVEEWLNEKLVAGPRLAKEIDEQAALDDVPPILLRRAKISLGIVPSGRNGSTSWRLPDAKASEVGWVDAAKPTTPIQQPSMVGLEASTHPTRSASWHLQASREANAPTDAALGLEHVRVPDGRTCSSPTLASAPRSVDDGLEHATGLGQTTSLRPAKGADSELGTPHSQLASSPSPTRGEGSRLQ